MIRNILRSVVLAVAMLSGLGVSAQIQAPADSVSTAMATSIGSYIRQSIENRYPAGSKERQQFVDALSAALMASPAERPALDGASEGLKLADNLEHLRSIGFNIDNKLFLSALQNIFADIPTGFTPQEADAYLSRCEQRVKQAEMAAQQAFLDAQAAREGVMKLPSGLLFEVITEGEGDTPKKDDTVEVFYTGRLADGKIFDQTGSSPASFPVDRLIPGFSEGLMMMKPGGTYRLFIPANLGYGDRGAGSDIPGGAALDFTVKLVGIK